MNNQGNYQKTFSTQGRTRFSAGMNGEVQDSVVQNVPERITAFNAGDIVPIFTMEILPRQALDFSLQGVIRQTTLLTPTMGNMEVEYLAFFVPNRVVNESAKSVFGENVYDSWTANPVSFVPLYNGDYSVQVPVGSVADYYDFPTQQPLPSSVLKQCNDLLFRGYIEIYNQYFRDQNYQPPIAYSKLNVYEGFFESNSNGDTLKPVFSLLEGTSSSASQSVEQLKNVTPDNAGGSASVVQSIYGNLTLSPSGQSGMTLSKVVRSSIFNALGKPLKANKIHDMFTSVLPSPQKGQEVFVPISGSGIVGVSTYSKNTLTELPPVGLRFYGTQSPTIPFNNFLYGSEGGAGMPAGAAYFGGGDGNEADIAKPVNLGFNVEDIGKAGASISVTDLRQAAAVQQVYELLARCGSRYRSYVRSFFGLEVDDPFRDIPELLGRFTRNLDLYQTAQTSATQEGGSPQGNLSAFGYTSMGGKLFRKRFFENGFLHVFAVVRHRNIYSAYMPKHLFRRSMLDFYQPQLANLSEQPIMTYQINPFASNPNQVFGYQEPWIEYRDIPSMVSGAMRTGVSQSLSIWNYADNFDSSLNSANPTWLKSNSEEVLNRSLAVTSDKAPQFKAQFTFLIDNYLPMPAFSVPGMDII